MTASCLRRKNLSSALISIVWASPPPGDPDLYEAAGFLANEKILVVNINNGARFDTYIIEGERGSGTVCLNGPAARQGQVGDIIIAMTFRLMDEETAKTFRPRTVHVDENNRITKVDS